MAILEVNNLKKVYTTRLGGNQVEALKNLSFYLLHFCKIEIIFSSFFIVP